MKTFYRFLYVVSFVLCLFPTLILAEEYIVGAGDILSITVFDHPEMQARVQVDENGLITVPLLAPVEVRGLTTSQVSQKLTTLLSDGFIVNPKVNTLMEKSRDQKAVILGQVVKPGVFELRPQTRLLELISQAGGLTVEAGDTAILKRESGETGQSSEVVIDLKKLVEQGDASLNMPIADGDKVFIVKAGFFYVTGEVKKPNSYKYQDDLTLIKALAMAGGFTDIADKKGVKVVRKINGKEEVQEKVTLDTVIQPEDVIVVPESFF